VLHQRAYITNAIQEIYHRKHPNNPQLEITDSGALAYMIKAGKLRGKVNKKVKKKVKKLKKTLTWQISLKI